MMVKKQALSRVEDPSVRYLLSHQEDLQSDLMFIFQRGIASLIRALKVYSGWLNLGASESVCGVPCGFPFVFRFFLF